MVNISFIETYLVYFISIFIDLKVCIVNKNDILPFYQSGVFS